MNTTNSNPSQTNNPVIWEIASAPVPYTDAESEMKSYANHIAAGEVPERVWLVEHPPLLTAGTSANNKDLLNPDALPVFTTGRGGQYTYHGPGQRVIYVMLDLKQRGRDVKVFVNTLEQWIIRTLAAFNIDAYTVPGRVGVWTKRPDKGLGREDKIAAIGIRLTKWVSYHGISLNVAPDLSHYDAIVPCGISDQGVTSFEDLGHLVSMPEVDAVLRRTFEQHFSPTRDPD